MVLLACISILSMVAGVALSAIRKNADEAKALGMPLLMLAIILSFGRRASAFHPYLMSGVIFLTLWNARSISGSPRWCALIAALTLGGALLSALILF